MFGTDTFNAVFSIAMLLGIDFGCFAGKPAGLVCIRCERARFWHVRLRRAGTSDRDRVAAGGVVTRSEKRHIDLDLTVSHSLDEAAVQSPQVLSVISSLRNRPSDVFGRAMLMTVGVSLLRTGSTEPPFASPPL